VEKLQLKPIWLYVSVLVLCLTPVYTLGFVIAVLLAARWRPHKIGPFASYLSRVVLHGLLLAGVIMVVGMYGWLLRMPLHPLLVFVAYGAPCLIVRYALPGLQVDMRIARSDWLAVGLASIPVVLIVLGFYVPRPTLASTVQIITNGFDNAAHLSLIETTYQHDGYVYGPYETIKSQIAWKTLTAYPQGWHLANAFMWKGTGLPIFSSTDRSLSLTFYVVTFLVWVWLAGFLLAEFGWYVAVRLLGAGRPRTPGMLTGFVAAHVLVQLVVLWGSILFGFASFLPTLCYFLLLGELFTLIHDERLTPSFLLVGYSAALLSAAAIGLSWLLPVLVVLGMICLSLTVHGKPLLARRRALLVGGAATLVTLVAIGGGVFVALRYSVEGFGQLNDSGGIFVMSSLLVGLMLALVGMVFYKNGRGRPVNIAVTIIAPYLLFIGLLYAWQMIKLGHTSYFFTKTLALLGFIVGPFFIASIAWLGSRMAFLSTSYQVVSVLAVVTGLVVVSGQDVASIEVFRHQSSQMDDKTATAFAGLVQDGRAAKDNVIVFTDTSFRGGDVTGNVLSTVLNQRIEPCIGDAIWLITDRRAASFPDWINRCATASAQHIVVLTSPATQHLIDDLHNPHIQTVVAK
jgi:hypothetical protein